MQNEMIKVMALQVLQEGASSIHSASLVTLMVDETTDASYREQVEWYICWVDANFEVHEDFIGLFMEDAINADTITAVIFYILRHLNISTATVRGNCYDGDVTMSGKNAGVVTKVLKEEPKALYTHCYGHSLSLACEDSIKHSKIIKDSLDTTYENTKLIKKSPRRDTLLEK